MPTAYIPAPGVLQVNQYFSSGTANAQNVWHVYSPTAWTPVRVADVLAVFDAWEGAHGANQRAAEIATTGFRGTDLTSLDGPTAFESVNIPGLSLGPAAPANTSFAIKLAIGRRGRGVAGRVFWFGVPEANVDLYMVHVDYADATVAVVNELIAALEAAGGYTLCVLHKVAGGVRINPMTQSAVLNAAYTDLYVDSQRDRLPQHKKRKKKITTP